MEKVKGSEDRLSALPDTVLGHILSYLPTSESVKTTALSKRWSSVWTNVPALQLDDSSLSCPDPNREQQVLLSFIQFLNNVFNLHYKPCSLQNLTLKCSKFDSCRVNEWIMAAIRHNVLELDLCVTMNEDFRLGVPLFLYQHLISLKIGRNFSLDIRGQVPLPCLKNLHLDSIEFSSDDSCRKLLSGCPVLEDLNMEECGMQNVRTLHITAPELKSLTFVDYWNSYYSAESYDYKFVVDAPKLEVLRYDAHMAKGYSFKNLDSLVDAYIDIDTDYWEQSKVNAIRKTALELVNGISNAKNITFTVCSLKDVLSFLDITTLPIFNKCTKLVLGGNMYCGMLLPKFLENSPVLQVLVLEQGEDSCNGSLMDFVWSDPIRVPQCLLCNLKSVEIQETVWKKDVLKFITYLVLNGKVLGKLKVYKPVFII